MKDILILICLSVIFTVVFFSILYSLTETSWGEWIVNLVIHPHLSNSTAKDLLHAVYCHIQL